MLQKIIILLLFTAITNINGWVKTSLIYKHFNFPINRSKFSKQPKWDSNFNFDKIEKEMASANIVKLVDMAKYLNNKIQLYHPVYLATLSNGLLAVFKPEKKPKFSLAEVAAYRASRFLKLNLVPPTVFKKYKNMKGSLQFFLTDAKTSKDFESKLSQKNISDMNIFFFVFGQTDNKPLNQIVQINNGVPYLALIDNAHMHHLQNTLYGDKPFICINGKKLNKECPFNKAIIIKDISREEFDNLFKKYIPSKQVGSFFRQARKYGYIRYILDKDILWIQKHRLNHTNKYYRSTINSLKNLNTNNLKMIWSDGLHYERDHCEHLIKLTLERRDQIIKAAKNLL